MVQAADLVIGPDHSGCNNQRHIALGKVVLHFLDNGDRRVIRVTDATHDLKGRVIEPTKAGQTVVQIGRCAFERLENRDRGQGRARGRTRPEEPPGRIDTKKIVDQGNTQQASQEPEYEQGHGVRHGLLPVGRRLIRQPEKT